MILTDGSAMENPESSPLLLLDIDNMSTLKSDTAENQSLNTFETVSKHGEFNKLLNSKSIDNVRNLEKNNWEESNTLKSNINAKFNEQVTSQKSNNYSVQYLLKKSLPELESCSIKELNSILEDMSNVVKEVSSELVQLLLENDALQQESDARNVAIEQLLKLTVNNSEVELKQIQMSVILPDNEDSDSS